LVTVIIKRPPFLTKRLTKSGKIPSKQIKGTSLKSLVKLRGVIASPFEKSPIEGGMMFFKKGKTEVLRYALWVSRKLSRTYGPMVRAPARAVELAFFLYGFRSPVKEPGTEKKPGWAVPDWQRAYREGPRTRINWSMLELNPYVKLLYRIRESTVHVRV